MPLDAEIKYFEANRANWLNVHCGKFALVKGEKLIGAYDSAENAISEGAKQFGVEPFLVRQITEKEESVFTPVLAFGLLDAALA